MIKSQKIFFAIIISFALFFIFGQAHASWDGNGVLTMGDAYGLALEHEAAHGAARQRLQAELELLRQANSGMLPRVNLEASGTLADYQDLYETLDTPVVSNSVGVYLTQPLYHPDLWPRYNKAEKQVRLAEVRLEADRQRLALELAEIYLEIIRLSREMELSQIELESYRLRWQQADASLTLGMASRADMLEAKARVDETVAKMMLTKRDRLRVIRDLQRRIGIAIAPDNLPLLSEEGYHPGEWNEEEWLKRAEENNLAVRIARLEKNVAAHEIEVRRSGHYPRITLKASVSDKKHDDLGVTQGPDSRVTLQLQLPLLDGGYTTSSVRQACSYLNQAGEALRNALETAMLQVRETLDNLESGKSNIAAWRIVQDARVQTVEAVEASHRVGFKDMVDLLDAQTRLNRTRRELNNSIHNHLLYRIRLNAAVGTMTIKALESIDSVLNP